MHFSFSPFKPKVVALATIRFWSDRAQCGRRPFIAVWFLLSLVNVPAHGLFQYVDVSEDAGIVGYTMQPGKGGSIVAADYDDDGDIDLFVPTAGGTPNQLYRNEGAVFVEVAEQTGLASLAPSRTALWLDYDGDHRLDLIVASDCYFMPEACDNEFFVHLYKQIEDAKFVDATTEAVITTDFVVDRLQHRGGISAGDINNDGFLGIVFAMWNGQYHLLLNTGEGTFTGIGVSSRMVGEDMNYYQHLLHGFDGDGYLDIVSVNDGDADRLWLNQGNNTFRDVAEESNTATAWNEMGIALGDFDNDGDFGIYRTNIIGITRWNVLHENESVGSTLLFEENARSNGVVFPEQWGWGCTFLDADNDGLLDLVVTNGFSGRDYFDDQSVFYCNTGTRFRLVSGAVGFNDALWGSSLIALDFDRDGHLDLAQSTEEFNGELSRIRLLHNERDTEAPPKITLSSNHASLGQTTVPSVRSSASKWASPSSLGLSQQVRDFWDKSQPKRTSASARPSRSTRLRLNGLTAERRSSR